MKGMRFALIQLLLAAAWLGAAGPRELAARLVPLGPEVLLAHNRSPDSPMLAVQPGGDYVAAWDEEALPKGKLFYRYVTAGAEPPDEQPVTLVPQSRSPYVEAVTATPRGFDVLWSLYTDSQSYYFRRHLNLQGEAEGEPIPLGGSGTDWVWNVRGNGFMAGWVLRSAHGIAARRLTSSGRRTGPELRLNSRPVDASRASVMAVADGGFVAVWYGIVPGGSYAKTLRARRFSPSGKPLGPDFDVNDLPVGEGFGNGGDRSIFAVAAAPGGGFVVAWMSLRSLVLSFFDAAGRALGPGVPAVTGDRLDFPESMAFDDVGNLLLLWLQGPDDNLKLQLQLFDSHGSHLGPPEDVNSAASGIYEETWQGSVAWTGDSWLVLWLGGAFEQRYANAVFVRRFAAR